MSRQFAYRVSVSGPDLDEYIRRVEATMVPLDQADHPGSYEWSGPRIQFASGGSERSEPMALSGRWLNATTAVLDTPQGRIHRLLGRFTTAPVWFFVREGASRGLVHRMKGGPFDDLTLNVEIIGMNLSCDIRGSVPGGKYSYRTVIVGGRIGEDDGWTSTKTAVDLAPELHVFVTTERE